MDYFLCFRRVKGQSALKLAGQWFFDFSITRESASHHLKEICSDKMSLLPFFGNYFSPVVERLGWFVNFRFIWISDQFFQTSGGSVQVMLWTYEPKNKTRDG